MSPVTAPTAPGRLNEPVQPQAMVGYLGELDAWVAARRSELAALRNDMQHDLAQVRVAQNVSPLYGDAMQMAVAGHSAEMIAERCGIARAEAELVVALTQSQAAAQHMQRGDEYGG